MKKIFILIFILAVFSTSVFAEQAKYKYGNETISTINVTGLENALIRVKNENAIAKIEANIAKITSRDMEELQELQNLQFTDVEGSDDVEASGQKNVKFLGFIKTSKTYKYNVLQDGTIVKKKGMFDFLYKEGE